VKFFFFVAPERDAPGRATRIPLFFVRHSVFARE
jgi:hypothetical protein